MNQKLSDWASLAEIVASIAVVITLVMLMIDVRENTEVVRSNSYDDLLGDVNEQAFIIAQDERLTHIWRLYNAGAMAELTDEERFTLLTLLRSTFRTFEKAYFAYQYGTVGAREYERFDTQACRHFAGMRSDLWGEIRQNLSDDHWKHVEELCM
jgi:hypothetical protein